MDIKMSVRNLRSSQFRNSFVYAPKNDLNIGLT
jgi:hypothetical protein